MLISRSDWVSFVIPQMYHNNIALSSDGREKGTNGYSYRQLSDMWAAANATKSNLVTMWWTPEGIHTTYLGTQSEMQKIALTWPTQECIDNRITKEQRCESETLEGLVGKAVGSCDEAPQMLHKVVVKNLHATTYDPAIAEARRSPAYDAIKGFRISELQYSDILLKWINRGIDTFGFDQRLATCQWIVENLSHLESIIPRTYPRVAHAMRVYEDPLIIAALTCAVIATVLTMATAVLAYFRRKTYAIRYAQVEFLSLLLLGLFLICLGASVIVLEPNNVTCNLSVWFVVLGYTIQLVPAIVKVSAIHKLMKAAERLQRLELPKVQLFGAVATVTTMVVIFLSCWSAIDPRQRNNEFFLSDEVNEDGETIVIMKPFCDSSGAFWTLMALAWFSTLMVVASVLAFKTRNLREELAESRSLALLVYSHFLFLILVVATFVFHGALPETYLVAMRSLIYSTDSTVTLFIYFLPKFTAARDPVRNMLASSPYNRSSLGLGRPEAPSLMTTNQGRSNRIANGPHVMNPGSASSTNEAQTTNPDSSSISNSHHPQHGSSLTAATS